MVVGHINNVMLRNSIASTKWLNNVHGIAYNSNTADNPHTLRISYLEIALNYVNSLLKKWHGDHKQSLTQYSKFVEAIEQLTTEANNIYI